MSENTLNVALRRLGYDKNTMTAHGFRSLASSLLNEQQWHRDAIERQLSHGERDRIRAAYNHADYLPERRRMMQAWADYLETLRTGAEIIPLARQADSRSITRRRRVRARASVATRRARFAATTTNEEAPARAFFAAGSVL